MFLHLGESLASQIQDRAAIWGLKESEAVRQLIHLGLRASARVPTDQVVGDPRHEYLRAMLAEILFVQVEALLYQRDTVADASAGAVVGNKTQRLSELDARVRSMARASVMQLHEKVERIVAERVARASAGEIDP